MLQGDMVEARTGKITIKDIDARTVELMISYVYTGQLETDKELDINKMIYAADKYDMPGLRALVYSTVASNHLEVVPGVLADMLVTANLHQSRELEEVALKRIRADREILEDPLFREKFKVTQNIDILFDIIKKL